MEREKSETQPQPKLKPREKGIQGKEYKTANVVLEDFFFETETDTMRFVFPPTDPGTPYEPCMTFLLSEENPPFAWDLLQLYHHGIAFVSVLAITDLKSTFSLINKIAAHQKGGWTCSEKEQFYRSLWEPRYSILSSNQEKDSEKTPSSSQKNGEAFFSQYETWVPKKQVVAQPAEPAWTTSVIDLSQIKNRKPTYLLLLKCYPWPGQSPQFSLAEPRALRFLS